MDVDERLTRVEGKTGSNQTSNQISDRARFVAHCNKEEIYRLLALHRNIKTGKELLAGTRKFYSPDGSGMDRNELEKSQKADMEELHALEARVRARMERGDTGKQA